MIGVTGDRGEVLSTGEVELRRRDPDNPYKIYAKRAHLNGSQGRGKFQIETRRCGGVVILTRMLSR